MYKALRKSPERGVLYTGRGGGEREREERGEEGRRGRGGGEELRKKQQSRKGLKARNFPLRETPQLKDLYGRGGEGARRREAAKESERASE